MGAVFFVQASYEHTVKLKITIDSKTYEVEVEAVEPEGPAQAPRGYTVQSAPVRVPGASPMVAGAQAGPVNEEKVCRSPVAGIVVRVVAQPGQAIQVGDILLVLEAMKMETNITAPLKGKVSAVKAAAGEGVQVGQVVVEFE
jgi:methylmalonyl-CoA carboxyltransferase small subunit